MNKIIALVALIAVLGIVNASIIGKEKHLAEGQVVYLELAPVDPRSLMQGDYMALNFRVAQQVYEALSKSEEYRGWNRNAEASDGYVVVSLDEKRIGTFQHLQDEQPLAKNEIKLHYRVRNGAVKFATNAFFFQEGHAQVYEAARYGEFRVNADGELLLAAMFDGNLERIQPDYQE
ncbi:MAG TPA: GDYXXLXY domain-containing protein [Cellvibrio sp.]|nr:GDYXXLXY domain-containing protein [Cellvibrio sp.]